MSVEDKNEKIKRLRVVTGAPINKIKEALDSCNEDVDAAIELLRRQGISGAAKKEAREVKEGMLSMAFKDGGFALVEVKVETDFVAKNERFQHFAARLAEHLLTLEHQDHGDFLASLIDGEKSVDEFRKEFIAVMGENTQIGRLLRIRPKAGHAVAVYSHMGGKIVAAVEYEGDASFEPVMRDVAMQVAAEAPEYLTPDMVTEDLIEKEKSILADQVKGKPEHVVQKIVEGRMADFYKRTCLVKQPFIKDPSQSVEQYVQTKTGGKAKLVGFYRLALGE